MAFQHEPRQLITPADDLEVAARFLADRFDRFAQTFVAANRDGQARVRDLREPADDRRRGAASGVNHVEEPAFASGHGRLPQLAQFGKLRRDRETAHPHLLVRHTFSREHRGRLVVRHEKQIARATKPDRIHRDRVGDANHPPESRNGITQNSLQQMRVGRINRHHRRRLKAQEQLAQTALRLEKPAHVGAVILLPIGPPVDFLPGARRAIDQREVAFSRPVVRESIGLGKKIVHLDHGRAARHRREAVAHSAGGGVVAFAKTGAQNQDAFLHFVRLGSRRRV